MFASATQTNRVIVLVTGGRDYDNPRKLWKFLDALLRERNIVLVVSGDCPTGTDKFARAWAHRRKVPYRGFPADWDDFSKPCVKRYREDGTPYNAAAGHNRNKRMATESHANLVVATLGRSGTADMIKIAKQRGIELLEVDKPTGKAYGQTTHRKARPARVKQKLLAMQEATEVSRSRQEYCW